MAFKAKVLIEDSEYDALSCDYSFRRGEDLKGRPHTNVFGGYIRIVVESNDDTDLVARIMNQFEPFSGSVTFHKGIDSSSMKELSWENGYIMKYCETFDVTSEEPMKIHFDISAEKITMGGETIDHKWPK